MPFPPQSSGTGIHQREGHEICRHIKTEMSKFINSIRRTTSWDRSTGARDWTPSSGVRHKTIHNDCIRIRLWAVAQPPTDSSAKSFATDSWRITHSVCPLSLLEWTDIWAMTYWNGMMYWHAEVSTRRIHRQEPAETICTYLPSSHYSLSRSQYTVTSEVRLYHTIDRHFTYRRLIVNILY